MLISYYEDGSAAPKKTSVFMGSLMALNGLLSAGILFAWTYVSLFVAEPLAWATWMPIQRGYGILGLFEYPFLLLWIWPLLGVFGSWVCLKGGHKVGAYAFVAVPLAMLLLILGWYYLTPTDWH